MQIGCSNCHCTIVNRHVTCLDVDVSTDMQKQNLSRATVLVASVPSLLLATHMWPRHLCLDSGNFTWASKHVTQKTQFFKVLFFWLVQFPRSYLLQIFQDMWPRHRCLHSKNFAWASKHITQKTRIIGVVHQALALLSPCWSSPRLTAP